MELMSLTMESKIGANISDKPTFPKSKKVFSRNEYKQIFMEQEFRKLDLFLKQFRNGKNEEEDTHDFFIDSIKVIDYTFIKYSVEEDELN